MQATAETINYEADALANANVPAISRPFDFRDVGAKAVPWAVEVHTDATPYELSSPDLQKCVQAGLQMPHLLSARMYRHGHANQMIMVKGQYDSVNDLAGVSCDGLVDRKAQIKYQLEVNGKYRTMTFPHWLLYFSGNQAGVAAPSQTPNGHEGSWIYYQCTPGPDKTKVRAFIKEVVEAPAGALLGQKVKEVNVQVPGAC